MTDDERRFEYAKNIATNGRVFSILLVLICLALYQGGAGKYFVTLAILATAPVGLSCIVDQLPPRIAALCSIAVYALSALVAILLFMSTLG